MMMCTDSKAQAEQIKQDKQKARTSFRSQREELKQRKELMAAKGLEKRVVLILHEQCFDVTDYHKEHPGNDAVQIGKLPPWNLHDVSDYYDKYHCDGGSVADLILEQAKQGTHPKIKYLGFSKDFFAVQKAAASPPADKTDVKKSEPEVVTNTADRIVDTASLTETPAANAASSVSGYVLNKCTIM